MDKKSYYAIIPANVRYDKNLKANAKLLYGEITALANEKGFCWSTNNYFANLYDVSKVSISKWISDLEKGGYISLEMVYKTGTNQIEQRKIFIADPIKENFNTYKRKVKDPIKEKFNTPIKEKFKDNIYNNNINNNTIENNTINTAQPKKVDASPKFSDLVESAYPNFIKLFEGENTLPKNKSQEITWKNALKWFEKNDYDLRRIYAAVKWAREDAFWRPNVLSLPALKNVRNSVRKIDNIMAKYNAVEAELKKPAAMTKIKNVKQWHYGKNKIGEMELVAELNDGSYLNQFILKQNAMLTPQDFELIIKYITDERKM